MKAHDVRALRPCAKCDGLGDRRQMILGHFHGECYLEEHSIAEVLALPDDERGKFRLGDGDAPTIKAIVESL